MRTLLIAPRTPEWSAGMTVLFGAAAGVVCYAATWGTARVVQHRTYVGAGAPAWMEWISVAHPFVIPFAAGLFAVAWSALMFRAPTKRVGHAAVVLAFCVPASALGFLSVHSSRWGDSGRRESLYTLIALLVMGVLALGAGWALLLMARVVARSQELSDDTCRMCGYVWGRADVERCWECSAPAGARRWYQGRLRWMRMLAAARPRGVRVVAWMLVLAWSAFLLRPVVYPRQFIRTFEGVGRVTIGQRFDADGYASEVTMLSVMLPPTAQGLSVSIAYGRPRSGSAEWMQAQVWQTTPPPPGGPAVPAGVIMFNYAFVGVLCEVPPERIARVLEDGVPPRLIEDLLAAAPATPTPAAPTPLIRLDPNVYWPQ